MYRSIKLQMYAWLDSKSNKTHNVVLNIKLMFQYKMLHLPTTPSAKLLEFLTAMHHNILIVLYRALA